MRLGTRKTLFGLIAGGILVLAAVVYIGTRQFDGELEVVDRQERCVAIVQSATPEGADETERNQLAACRAEGWTPPPR